MRRGRGWAATGLASISVALAGAAGTVTGSAMTAASLAGCGGSEKPKEPAPQPSKYRKYSADDERDDGVAVASSRGVLEPEQVHAGMSPHSDALSACYISRVAGRRWLGGNLVLRWAVNAEGQIVQVHVAESDLGAWPVERCLLEVARQMTFEAPRGGPTDFTVPLGFSSVKRAEAWSEEESAAAVGEQPLQLQECTAAEAIPPRNVLITLYASSKGPLSVGFATAEAAGLTEAWADCAEKLALAWRVAAPPPAPGHPARQLGAAPVKLTVRYAAP